MRIRIVLGVCLLVISELYAQVLNPQFSHERGYYEQGFSLELSTDTPGATIRYTMDGSEPTPTHGTVYSSSLSVSSATFIRAIAYKAGEPDSETVTATYLFPDDVIDRTTLLPGWPSDLETRMAFTSANSEIAQGAFRQNMVAAYRAPILAAFKEVPTVSVVTDQDGILDPVTGFLHNNNSWKVSGLAWERAASLEFIYPDGRHLQVNCGVRLHGGASRAMPKAGLKFYFRGSYGPKKLKFDLFDQAGTPDEFDNILFIPGFNDNPMMIQEGGMRRTMTKDTLAHRLQHKMNGVTPHGRFVHLFLNGCYWGVYRMSELPRGTFASHYLGCDEEEADVVKHDTSLRDHPVLNIMKYYAEASDGTTDAWDSLLLDCMVNSNSVATFMKVQGRDANGDRDLALPVLIDMENYIDYLMIGLLLGHTDWGSNNWYAMRDRSANSTGFKFLCWDVEKGLEPDYDSNIDTDRSYGVFHPFNSLRNNPELKQLMGDRIQKMLFHGGPLDPTTAISVHDQVRDEMRNLIITDLSRWYVADTWNKHTRTQGAPLDERWSMWHEYTAGMAGIYSFRYGLFLEHCKAEGFYPSIDAPVLSQFGGLTTAGTALTISNPNGSGTIYYTLDGTDPRKPGGAVSSTAQTYSGSLALNKTTSLITRIKSGSTWSAREEVVFTVGDVPTTLEVTELMVKPGSTNAAEFVELYNSGGSELDLSGMSFSDGFRYTFPSGSKIAAGGYLVLTRRAANYRNTYSSEAFGQYAGKLSNSGERLELVDALGRRVLEAEYNEVEIPSVADGGGYSLVREQGAWRASNGLNGSPGVADPSTTRQRVLINEVLTHTDAPLVDAIEFYNPNNSAIDLTGWFLTDDSSMPQKYTIPSGITVPANGYAVIYELDAGNGNTPGPYFGGAFSLDSHGEKLFISSPDQKAVHGVTFGAAANGVSFGRHTTSEGVEVMVAQSANSLGTANGAMQVGPVVIKEIYYHGQGDEVDYVVLENIDSNAVKLWDDAQGGDPSNTWKIKGLDFAFPANTTLGAGELAVVVCSPDLNAFQTAHAHLASSAQLFSAMGSLDNDGEAVSLLRPDKPDVDPVTHKVTVPWIVVDRVRYNDASPWPIEADGQGHALVRNTNGYGDDALSWSLGVQVGSAAGSRITASKDRIKVSVELGQVASAESFQVWNSGSGTLRYTVDGKSEAFDVSASGGSSSGLQDKQTYQLNFTTANLDAGLHELSVYIHSPDAVNSPMEIPVAVEVVDPDAVVLLSMEKPDKEFPELVSEGTVEKEAGVYKWPIVRDTGKFGDAFVLRTNDLIVLQHPWGGLDDMKVTDLTVSFWLKAENDPNGTFEVYALDHDDDDFKTFQMRFSPSKWLYYRAERSSSQSSIQNAISADTWHHYVYTRDANTDALYRDGVELKSANVTRAPKKWRGLYFQLADTSNRYLLDDVRVYRKKISAAEVLELAEGAVMADAGIGASAMDTNGNGTESFTLDGSGSSADAGIASYQWKTNGVQLATGVSPSVSLPLGTHTIELTVTDNAGGTAKDYVTYTVSNPASQQSGYDQWAQNALNGVAQNQRMDDPDGDGMLNLAEYAFDTDPVAQNSAQIGTISLNTAKTKAIYDYKTPRTDIEYQLYYNLDLVGGTWMKHELPVTGNGGMTRKYLDYSTLPAGADNALFLRLEVSEKP